MPPENVLQLLPSAVAPPRDALIAYWTRVAPRALRHLGGRPLKLVRHVHNTTFYHMGPLPPTPPPVHRLHIAKAHGDAGVRLWVDSLEGLLGLVEIGAVELHPWGARVDDIEHPDRLVFDLDPGDGVAWDFVLETALAMRDFLAAEGIACWPKTTGGKGLHLMIDVTPGLDWSGAHTVCRDLAASFAARAPARYTLSAKPAARHGKLFLDYLRNGRGTTAVGAYSPRARPGAPIAAPVSWRALERGLRSDAFSLNRLPPRAADPLAR